MRYLALLLIAGALAAADVKQLGPNEDLPFCRVVLNMAATIDKDQPVYETRDGWYCAATGHLFPLVADKRDLFPAGALPVARIVKVTPAAAQPGRMPNEHRAALNAFIAKNHPQMPDATAAASTPAVANKP